MKNKKPPRRNYNRILKVKYLHDVKALSFRAIATQLNRSSGNVYRWYKYSVPSYPQDNQK